MWWLIIPAIFLATRGQEWPAAVLAIVVAVHIAKRFGDPERNLRNEIRRDAGQHGVVIPHDDVVWSGLRRLYALYKRTSRTYSQLAPQYAEIIDSMWLTLRNTHDLREWRRVVGSVGQEWPTPYGSGDSPLNDSLAKAKTAARRWQEAHREAHSQ
jgi:hypothetical protein